MNTLNPTVPSALVGWGPYTDVTAPPTESVTGTLATGDATWLMRTKTLTQPPVGDMLDSQTPISYGWSAGVGEPVMGGCWIRILVTGVLVLCVAGSTPRAPEAALETRMNANA